MSRRSCVSLVYPFPYIEMGDSHGDRRWAAHLVSDLHTPELLTFRRGTVVWQARTRRLLLLNDRGGCVDARAVRPGEEVEEGKEISFPCHLALVGWKQCEDRNGGGFEEEAKVDRHGGRALNATRGAITASATPTEAEDKNSPPISAAAPSALGFNGVLEEIARDGDDGDHSWRRREDGEAERDPLLVPREGRSEGGGGEWLPDVYGGRRSPAVP